MREFIKRGPCSTIVTNTGCHGYHCSLPQSILNGLQGLEITSCTACSPRGKVLIHSPHSNSIVHRTENNQGQRFRKESDLWPNCLKEHRQRSCSLKRTMTRDSCKDYGQGVVAKSWRGLEMRVHSVARGLCLAQKTFIYQHSLSHLHVNCLPILSSPKELPLKFSFLFGSGLWPC